MVDEVTSRIRNNTWSLVDRTTDMDVIRSRIVLRNKFGADGRLQRRKARLVAQGFSQRPGVHYSQTFASVARLSTVRLLTSLAARYSCAVNQLDVTTAYLNGKLKETIHMRPPKGLEKTLHFLVKVSRYGMDVRDKARLMLLRQIKKGNKVCRLNKALYGLHQKKRAWHTKLNRALTDIEAMQSKCDPCLYRIGKGNIPILIYVDDIPILSPNKELTNKVIDTLSNMFEVKNLGEVNSCLDMEFRKHQNEIHISQTRYISELLEIRNYRRKTGLYSSCGWYGAL